MTVSERTTNSVGVALVLPSSTEARLVALDFLTSHIELDESSRDMVARRFAEIVCSSNALQNECPLGVAAFASLLETLVVRDPDLLDAIEADRIASASSQWMAEAAVRAALPTNNRAQSSSELARNHTRTNDETNGFTQ